MSTESAWDRLGDYLVSDLSGRQFLSASVAACLASVGLLLALYLVAAFLQRDPKRRHDWLEGSRARALFRLLSHGLIGLISIGLCRLLGFPGQVMPVVVLIAVFLPFGFLADIVYGFLIDPWQGALRRAPRRCAHCGKTLSLRPPEGGGAPQAASAVDFDEWNCVCGAVRVDGYGGGKPLSDCPKCGFKTWRSTIEAVRPASQHADGEGIDHRRCVHCHHEEKVNVILSRHR
ncbi:MAG: hypothetical protein J0L75_17405 [Spirochaetes bacterium]|nr:hypothetical protein [Spirochaetota bacterium]